ncbi:uncharacterized protein TRAVEDRAFT_28283 [Trametes versicolor FP-101664 SS1]|uniref:uncharacterized protein n=1 Tax=Trametes versicolor (strain FP-101664) TaxID=717944 RepID=UPI0004621E5B|nr:uncharacterized protein TRAVEDRAFT_28283 [Trametes versicolor FP-101664 SS1]EIW60820.1 hypothetical protein TRAVEDRAFT_28283 [Trametes versicolor FP-101664 SS1]
MCDYPGARTDARARVRRRTHGSGRVRPARQGTSYVDLSPPLLNGNGHSRLRVRGVCQRCRRASATCPTLTAKEATTVGLSVDDVMDRRRVSPCLACSSLGSSNANPPVPR